MSKNEEKDSGFSLDPDVEKEISDAMTEEEIIGMYSGGSNSEERIPLIEEFAPDEEQWGGKTIFQRGQPRAVTLADNLPQAFPVLLPTEEFLTEVIEDYEMRLTSLEGISREQLMKIFISMFGGKTGEEGGDVSSMELMLSTGPDDDS